MKPGALLLISLFFLVSCSKKEEATPPEKWQLLARGPLEIVDDWIFDGIPRQYYLFYEDQTFSKHLEEGETLKANGTFEVHEEEEGVRYVLKYEEANPLIENCSDENVEHLYFMREDAMANVSCTPEDGSASIYLRIKEE